MSASSVPTSAEAVIERATRLCATGLPGMMGIRVVEYRPGQVETELLLQDHHLLTAGGLIHAGTPLTLADTSAGWGCLVTLPPEAHGFTTTEAKMNFTATAQAGEVLSCVAHVVNQGRTTQLWDAEVTRRSDGRLVAAYRCTQLLLAHTRLSGGYGSGRQE